MQKSNMHMGDRDLSGQLFWPGSVWTGTENLAPQQDSILEPSIPWRVIILAKINFSIYSKIGVRNFNRTSDSSIENNFSYSSNTGKGGCGSSRRRRRRRRKKKIWRSEVFLFAKFRKRKMFSCLKLVSAGHSSFSFLSYCRRLALQIFELEP